MSVHITVDDIEPCLFHADVVLTTLTNRGYMLYTLNMLKSLRPFGLDTRVLVVCLDEPCAAVFRRLGYCVVCVHENQLAAFSSYNASKYDKICYYKVELLYRILSLGKHALLLDGDLVFHKDPRADIEAWASDARYDVWIQNDAPRDEDTANMCTGYMFLKSSPSLCERYDCVSEKGREKYLTCALDNNDQTYFNRYVKPYCRMKALPLEMYPNGSVFYQRAAELAHTAILVHFNWLHGHQKMAKMKEHKMWLLTEDEEEDAS